MFNCLTWLDSIVDCEVGGRVHVYYSISLRKRIYSPHTHHFDSDKYTCNAPISAHTVVTTCMLLLVLFVVPAAVAYLGASTVEPLNVDTLKSGYLFHVYWKLHLVSTQYKCVLFHPWNQDTSLIRTLSSGPKGVHISRFHCNAFTEPQDCPYAELEVLIIMWHLLSLPIPYRSIMWCTGMEWAKLLMLCKIDVVVGTL